ncbi:MULTISPECIES: hypothetical protein [Desulfatibacillum]|jgi:hypothetical protein|uniref:Uncharacterized protein n=2 Tax=Desulfatibacillum TaxID=218207 RepID=B8FKH3_DESAL|nr:MULTISPECIES: hypothetical protein [Desulfatibacillum]ACL01788.1 hypothetical protein Dalk_0078 [Desulfatibacillum aliphaticivorans]SHJ95572.1 hypothetical protein SAMN02745216_02599 [Desulfatibacillum alkenivorans DSM 16219]
MAVKRLDDKDASKTAILRVTVPKRLLNEIRETKKKCKEKGFSFDIKPDVARAIENAISEAKKVLAEEGD